MHARIVLLPGDGIGPEIVAQAERVLEAVAGRFGHSFETVGMPIGGGAIDEYGTPLPEETLAACRSCDAILLGAVGGPKWDDPAAATRPEAGLLTLRRELGLFANLRPIQPHPALLDASPLKREIIEGVDILFVRELTGGIYFGREGREPHESGERAFSTMEYTTGEIARVVRLAAQLARTRRGRLTSVDKANVLEVSRLWRKTAAQVMAGEFPDVSFEVVLVDAMAMHLLARPRDFDVIVTGNMFGDILTDEGSMLSGSLGVMPSASLGEGSKAKGQGSRAGVSDGKAHLALDPRPSILDQPTTHHSPTGLYEPIHGSAPDIAGRGIANPLATILAAAMLLRHSLHLEEEAAAVEAAVDAVLKAGHRTPDIAAGAPAVSTTEMGDRVCERI